MKKVICVILSIMLIASLAVTAYAAGTATFTVTPSSTVAYKGDEIVFTVSVNYDGKITSVGFAPTYDSSYFELVDGSISGADSAMMKGFDGESIYAAWFGSDVEYTGTMSFTLKALKDVADIQSTVSGDASISNSVTNETIAATVVSSKVTVSCKHSYGDWDVKEATCTEAGQKTQTCSKCGDVNEEVIAKLPHTEKETVTASTCTVAGSKVVTCEVCGEKISETALPLAAHTEKETVTPSTCAVKGTKVVTCSVCGTEISKEELPLAAHTEKETVTPSTCETAGTKVVTCEVCNTEISKEELPLADHTFGDPVETPATCTEAGKETGTCTVCGETTENVIPALGHDEMVATVAATCEVAGSKTTTCSRCDLKKVEEIPALGHKWNSGMVTKEATCSEDGVKTFTCQNDTTHTYTEVIPATGEHVFTNDYDVTEDEHTGKCICGEKGETVKHSYVIPGKVTVESTATTEGEQEWLCECGAKTTKVLPKVDLDDVPKTGDITNQVVLTAVGMFSLIAAAAYVFKRKLAK